MHGYPFSRVALADRSATQKSCRGSGSAPWTAQTEKARAQTATKSMALMDLAIADRVFSPVNWSSRY